MDDDAEDLVVAVLALRRLEHGALDGENIPRGVGVAHGINRCRWVLAIRCWQIEAALYHPAMIAKPFIQTPRGQRAILIEFGRPADADKLRSWRSAKDSPSHAMADALEFGKLAGKRWRYYLKRNEAALSMDELTACVGKVPQAEIGFLIVAKATWSPGPRMLGVAWCRRTWCNHIVLDFLAAHPSTLGPGRGYAGIGTALLCYVAEVAGHLDAPLVWGEATALSAPFYRRILGQDDILDHFFIRDSMVAMMREQLKLRSTI